RRNLRARRDVPEIKADAGHDAFLERIFVNRYAACSEMPGCVDMGAGMVAHRDEHRGQPVPMSGFDEGLFVRLPQAMDNRRMAGINRRPLIKLPAEIDDPHDSVSLCSVVRGSTHPARLKLASFFRLAQRSALLRCSRFTAPRPELLTCSPRAASIRPTTRNGSHVK